MWQQALKQLFVDTIYTPRAAARQVLALQVANKDVWTILTLTTILNAIAYAGTVQAFPTVVPPVILSLSPFVLTGMFFVSMALGAMALFWGGRTIGGVASFTDILVLITWLQFVRLAIQIVTFVLLLFLPVLAGVFNFLATIYVLWILLNFINEAQGFDSIGKSFANIILGLLGLMMALSFIISAIGLGAYEIR